MTGPGRTQLAGDGATTTSAPFVTWNPLPGRRTWRWPGGARVAVSFLFHVEFVPLTPPGAGAVIASSIVHRGPYPDYIDVHEVTPHEYGNRVGLFRLMELFDRRGFAASAAVDTVIAERYPYIVEEISRRNWAVLGHGVNGGRLHSELVPERIERDAITRNLDVLRRTFDREIRGWAGVEYAESSRTVELLRAGGLDYVCGWPNDEQPYEMADDFVCVPVAIHLDDIFAGRQRKITAKEHADLVIRALDQLVDEDGDAPRLLVLGLRPWYSGQPFRSKQIGRVLDRVSDDPRIWVGSTDAVVDQYLAGKADLR